MATVLVEKTKKQEVIPIPHEIGKLDQHFYPFFNPHMYHHKPLLQW